MGKLVALTGVSGFIGSFTARTLAAAGHRVRGLVRQSSRRDHLGDAVAEYIVGDQSDPDSIDRLIRGVDTVIHNSVDWDLRATSELRDIQSNVMGSLQLLEATRLAGIGQFIFVSSVAALGQIPPSAAGHITEETAAWPLSTYGAYKVAVEAYLKAYHASYRMNTSAFRPAAVYGVDPKLSRSQWYELISRVRRGDTIDEPKGGKITHVQDVADALTLAVGDASVAGEFHNLAERYIYWQTVAEIAKELCGSSATIVDRKGSGPKNQFDTAKSVAFFERHGNRTGLRRGIGGVREYVAELLNELRD